MDSFPNGNHNSKGWPNQRFAVETTESILQQGDSWDTLTSATLQLNPEKIKHQSTPFSALSLEDSLFLSRLLASFYYYFQTTNYYPPSSLTTPNHGVPDLRPVTTMY